jgi:hypothetical protein
LERKPPAEWSLAARALRAVLVYPVLLVGPWLLIARLSATAGDDDVVWPVGLGFWLVPLGALASLAVSLSLCLRGPLGLRERVGLVLLAVIGAGGALVWGFALLLAIAEIDCAGRYECPI